MHLMKLHEYKIAEKLRKARALATELRVLLEEVQSDITHFNIMADNVLPLEDDVDEIVMDAGTIEEWLDELPINADGTAAIPPDAE
jgi:hypothetical protein